MRLAIVGLSLIIFGCGGGGGDGESQQSTVTIPGIALPVSPTIWTPRAESNLSDVSQARSALITAFDSINISMQLTEPAFDSLDGLNSDDIAPVTKACSGQGVMTVTLSHTDVTSKAGYQFGQCRESDVIMNGSLSGTRNVNGISDYQLNASIASPVSDDKIFANSRLIRHEVRPVTFDGITDRLSFDMTVAGVSTAEGINTGGTVVVRTIIPLQFRDVITTPPEEGEIIITNAANRVWRATVVQNGFEISEVNNDTAGPIEFLSWYSLVQ